MFITVGEKLFGVVDQVPGHFYVATPFLHICEFPLVPGRSYLVLHGSQVDPGLFRKGSFAGYSIYWSLKSIALAWFRGLLGLLSLIAVITAGITYLVYFNDKKDPQYLHIGLAASGTLLIFLGAYWISLRLAVANRRRLVAMARRLEGKYPKAALVVQEYLKASESNSRTSENGLV
ncbi:MAG TPA: hypothetical protein VN688_28995 [Gemmataceae bacterium]|nr:hypothetical protein [Gemmataceae bacterium]